MPGEFLAANFILRFITQDAPEQSKKARALMEQLAQGSRVVITSESVLTEVVRVLSSKALYNLARQDVQVHVSAIVTLRGLKLPHKKTYLRALDLFASTNLDFVDALKITHMER